MITRILVVFTLLIGACAPKTETNYDEPAQVKIITAGGTVTEVVNALGFGDQIIATDLTSTFPASMQDLPSIGYRNQIKAEGILALGPDVILMEEGYLTPDVVEQLKAAQIEIHAFAKPKKVEETYTLVSDLGKYLEAESAAKRLQEAIQSDIAELEQYLQSQETQPKAAFIMARGPQTVFLAGEKTFAEEIFGLAKIEYPSTGFEDFVPLTPEALVKINPDYLVFFESGIQTLGGEQGLTAIQGMTETTAFQEGNIVALDGNYLSGFGPRVGQAALDLAKAVREK